MTATLKTTIVQEPSSATANMTLDTSGGVNFGAASTIASVPIATTTGTQTLTNKTLTSPTITGASMSSMASSVLTSETAKASTSGTEITFTGIPSWVKRITVAMVGVSTNGTTSVVVQIGSGSYTTSGYTYTVGGNSDTSGFRINSVGVTAAVTLSCLMTITNMTGNTWVAGATMTQAGSAAAGAGSVTLSGTLDRLRLFAGGTDTFDAGTINIIYE